MSWLENVVKPYRIGQSRLMAACDLVGFSGYLFMDFKYNSFSDGSYCVRSIHSGSPVLSKRYENRTISTLLAESRDLLHSHCRRSFHRTGFQFFFGTIRLLSDEILMLDFFLYSPVKACILMDNVLQLFSGYRSGLCPVIIRKAVLQFNNPHIAVYGFCIDFP